MRSWASKCTRARLLVVALALSGAAGMALCGARAASTTRPDETHFAFRDVGDETGLLPDAGGIRGHAAAWGDVDGSGYPSLFIGTFHEAGSKSSQFFRNDRGRFHLDDQPALRLSSCASGAIFADLTNNGRLDLYVSNNAHGPDGPKAAPSALFRNDGGGKFADVSSGSGACPAGFQGRTVLAADFDGDGLVDLLACDFYYTTKASAGVALFHNKGNYRFEDVAASAGLPRGAAIAGAAAADLNGDGAPDLVLTSPDGNNRVFLNDGHGRFHEATSASRAILWQGLAASDPPTGVCIADVNRDGLPDIVIGHHFKTPWLKPAPIRLYLNRGVKADEPQFEDVTVAAGLEPLAMKAPQVEIQDFDNDGLPDISVSIVKFKDGRPYPIIFRNMGTHDGIPRFRDDAWGVNDFPTEEDRSRRGGTTPFFQKMLRERKITYAAAGPSADFDRDGRLDLFLATWWTEERPLLLRNETPGGHWLDVQVQGSDGVNRMGIGCKVSIYPAGKLGDAAARLGMREIGAGYGWCSGQEAIAHFGLGAEQKVDVEVVLPFGKGKRVRQDVAADQRLTIK